MDKYRKYFNINPDYFPAVNSDLIKKDPDLWKKFYPHETFITLLKKAMNVIERKEKLNIWVEGAYGTGKSHAVLTLKHLLDATEQETEEYFNKYNLDEDLRKKFINCKKQGRIITVHRLGSSSIYGDNDLFLAIQESIDAALKQAGIENAGPGALKEAIIKYLSDDENKRSFEVYVKGSYKDLFGGEGVNEIITHLENYTDQALQELMSKIFKVANEKNIRAFTLTDDTMVNWITEVIKANNLKAIVFIWDEFTEYFKNNSNHFTGFQRILDLSQREPFCFIPVTHKAEGGLDNSDPDKKKIMDRFCKPTCKIELPENMAFILIGAAMQIKDDEQIKDEWDEIKDGFELRAHDTCDYIEKKFKIEAKSLKCIFPIHPFTAVLLKHISASYASNQRSMFDFIKNSGNEKLKGFQWYMDVYGPDDENPFLTIDLLWDFFYENGKDDLAQNIRIILDRYNVLSKQLDHDEKRVLKTILLLQAVWQGTNCTSNVLQPSDKNIDLAFKGSDLGDGLSLNIASKLIKDKIIYSTPISGTQNDGNVFYSVLVGEMDFDQVSKKEEEYQNKTVADLLNNADLKSTIDLPHDLTLRFNTIYAGVTDYEGQVNKAINLALNNPLVFPIVVTMAKTSEEATAIRKKILKTFLDHPESNIVIVDCGKNPLGKEKFDTWVKEMATSSYFSGKNNQDATTHQQYANNVLTEWRTSIKNGPFDVYTNYNSNGETVVSMDNLYEKFKAIDRKRFPLAIECHYKSITNWWTSNNLKNSAECGIQRVLKGTLQSSVARLQEMLKNAWNTPNYWENHPAEQISQMKIKTETLIQQKLKETGRISIRAIFEELQEEPFGLVPCNLTAFFLGFILKEYVDTKYSWSDGTTSDTLSTDKMKDMIEEILKNVTTPNPRYRDKYIVTMTQEEKAFIDGTSLSFDIPKNQCSSTETVRSRIRMKMKDVFSFPIWTILEVIDTLSTKRPKSVIQDLINEFKILANNDTNRSDSEVATKIGKLFMNNPHAAEDLHQILTGENCKKGMLNMLDNYKNGELPAIAKEINDHGQYLNAVRQKMDASDAVWLWKEQTVHKQIDSVITEYRIALETCKLIGSCSSYSDAINLWKEKCSNIKIALETSKGYIGDVLPLLNNLKDIMVGGSMTESKKDQFLNDLVCYGPQFNSFYSSQSKLFKEACSFDLQDMSDTDVEYIFKKIPGGYFTADKVKYAKVVEEIIAQYKKEQGTMKLKNLWKEKTSTESPLKWSTLYRMPIQALIPDSEWAECSQIFAIVSKLNPSETELDKALLYLNKFKYWHELNNAVKRDAAFKSALLGDNCLMIDDIEELKKYLVEHVSAYPYYWMGDKQVQKLISNYAQKEYNAKGYEQAFTKIESMEADEVKKYLKELIKNNMVVGLQIIKG